MSFSRKQPDLFSFEWEEPHSEQKQQHRWTVLSPGFADSPNPFSHALEKVIEKAAIPKQLHLLQHMDDIILLSGEDIEKVNKYTIYFLNHLYTEGLPVSKEKLQYVEPEVKYFSHLISAGKRRIGPERVERIVSLPLSQIKQELKKFLGVIIYCWLRIESYALRSKLLYEKLANKGPDPLIWSSKEVDQINKLKHRLMSARFRFAFS